MNHLGKYLHAAGASFTVPIAVSLATTNEFIRLVGGLMGLATGFFMLAVAYRKWKNRE